MSKFFSFGDIHFSCMNKWNYDAGNNFIKWFENYDFGPKEECEIAFAGDISERDLNPGKVIDQMDRFFELCSLKFASTYICMGNHDKKLYRGEEQHALMFLENKPNIYIAEDETVFTTKNGFNILMLPHQRLETETVNDRYNSIADKFQEEYDVIMGHWQIKSLEGPLSFLDGVDITKYKAKQWAIGHIHTRDRQEYIGSVWPNNVSEQFTKYPRCYKVIDSETGCSEVFIPEFLHYETLVYGEPIPEQKENCTYVYTISSCANEKQAREKYPEVYIRGIESRNKVDMSNITSDSDADGFNIALMKSFDNMLTELDVPVSRTAYSMVKKILTELDEKTD